MEALITAALITWAIKSWWERGRGEFDDLRAGYAKDIARENPGWSDRRVQRAATRRARSRWWNEIKDGFPQLRNAWEENKLLAEVERAEADAAGVRRTAELYRRLKEAHAERERWIDELRKNNPYVDEDEARRRYADARRDGEHPDPAHFRPSPEPTGEAEGDTRRGHHRRGDGEPAHPDGSGPDGTPKAPPSAAAQPKGTPAAPGEPHQEPQEEVVDAEIVDDPAETPKPAPQEEVVDAEIIDPTTESPAAEDAQHTTTPSSEQFCRCGQPGCGGWQNYQDHLRKTRPPANDGQAPPESTTQVNGDTNTMSNAFGYHVPSGFFDIDSPQSGSTHSGGGSATGDTYNHGAWNRSSAAVQDILGSLSAALEQMLASLTTKNAGRDQIDGVTAWADKVRSAMAHGEQHIADTNARQDPVVHAVGTAGGTEQVADMDYYAEV